MLPRLLSKKFQDRPIFSGETAVSKLPWCLIFVIELQFSQAYFYFLQIHIATYFQMADFFRNKLVTGHAFHSATKVAALGILHAHPLLEPHAAYSEGLPYLREYIASLLWVDSTAFSLAAMHSLPAEARASLCQQLRPRPSPQDLCGPR